MKSKKDIRDAVYNKVGGLDRKKTKEVVDALFDIMKEELFLGNSVKIMGFGSLDIVELKERIIFGNYYMPYKRIVRFHVNNKFLEYRINNRFVH